MSAVWEVGPEAAAAQLAAKAEDAVGAMANAMGR